MRMRLSLLVACLVGLLAARAEAVEVKEVITPLGLKAWLVEDKATPIVALSFAFASGSASEPGNQKGVTSLAAMLLTDGAGPLDAQAFKQRQQDAAASLGFSASSDRLSGSLRVLSANREQGFELLRLALSEARFDEDMIEQRRAQVIGALNQATQRPATVAQRTLTATVFAGHPYAQDTSGLRESLKTLTAADLKARAQALLVRTGLTITAVGDIDESGLAQQLDKAFGSLPLGVAPPPLPDWVPTSKPRSVNVERPVPQSAILIAMPGIPRDDPDWYAYLVMSNILGGGQQSRLFSEVREKRGLAYSVSAGIRTYAKAALMVISSGSASEKVAETLRVIRTELVRLRSDGVSEQELADAKTYLSGAVALSLDSSGAIAGLMQSLQLDGLPRDHLDKRPALIAAVKLEDVRRVARRVLRDEAMTTVVVGKPASPPPAEKPE
jgi:zinc protease